MNFDRVMKAIEGLPDDTEIPFGVLVKVEAALKDRDERIAALREVLDDIASGELGINVAIRAAKKALQSEETPCQK